MNEKLNLFNLIDIISSKTHQDREVVKVFITQLFKEIEKGLTMTSFVNIEGLGIFRIIKSLPYDRILFLSGLEGDKKAKETEINTENEHLEEITIKDSQTNSETNHPNTFSETIKLSQANDDNKLINEKEDFELYPSTSEDYKGEAYSQKESIDDNVVDDSLDFLAEYETHEKEERRKKKSSNARIITLLIITIIGVFLLLYFLYPRQERDDLSAPISTATNAPNYTLLENKDSINTICIIQADSELDFVFLAQEFYGYGMFWPYIYKANEAEIPTPFDIIKEGTVITIPKLDEELIDKNNKESVDKAKILADEIMKLKGNSSINK